MWGSHLHCRWHYRLREEWQRTWLPPTWNHRAYQESWHQAQWWEVCYQDKGVQFLRHALHTRWGQAKPSQVQAIKNLEPPKDKKELHTFLRMATYIELIHSQVSWPHCALNRPLKRECRLCVEPITLESLWKGEVINLQFNYSGVLQQEWNICPSCWCIDQGPARSSIPEQPTDGACIESAHSRGNTVCQH